MKAKNLKSAVLIGSMSVLGGCGSDEPPAENVFEDQTAALGKAEDTNRMLEQAAEAQRRAIDEQSQ